MTSGQFGTMGGSALHLSERSTMLPHFHLSGMEGVVLFLYIVAVFGALHLLAASFPNNRLASAWLSLNF